MERRRESVWPHLFETLLSWYVFFEVYYYMTHDGETLHSIAREKVRETGDVLREKANTLYALHRTREEIISLPETEPEGNASNTSNV